MPLSFNFNVGNRERDRRAEFDATFLPIIRGNQPDITAAQINELRNGFIETGSLPENIGTGKSVGAIPVSAAAPAAPGQLPQIPIQEATTALKLGSPRERPEGAFTFNPNTGETKQLGTRTDIKPISAKSKIIKLGEPEKELGPIETRTFSIKDSVTGEERTADFLMQDGKIVREFPREKSRITDTQRISIDRKFRALMGILLSNPKASKNEVVTEILRSGISLGEDSLLTDDQRRQLDTLIAGREVSTEGFNSRRREELTGLENVLRGQGGGDLGSTPEFEKDLADAKIAIQQGLVTEDEARRRLESKYGRSVKF